MYMRNRLIFTHENMLNSKICKDLKKKIHKDQWLVTVINDHCESQESDD